MTVKSFNPTSIPWQGEQDFVQNCVDEAIQICGVDMQYTLREMINRDSLFGEATISDFTSEYVIEMEIMSIKSFGGDGDILSHFGIEHTDEATFRVSARRWRTEFRNTEIQMPRAGDLIYLPTNDSLWEIRYVKNDENFQRFGRNYSYRLECSLFQYSGENINTGDEHLDQFDDLMEITVDKSHKLIKTLQLPENNFNDETDLITTAAEPIDSDNPFGI